MSQHQDKDVVELTSRLIYSLLKGGVRLGVRAGLPMERMVGLLELAYFEEHRRRHPKNLDAVAEELGVSLRTVTTLNKRFKEEFFKPENEVEPLRQVMAALDQGTMTLSELKETLPSMSSRELGRTLKRLESYTWVRKSKDGYAANKRLRSYVDETLPRAIDGVNHQVRTIADAVWERFVMGEGDRAAGRSWSFMAVPDQVHAFLKQTLVELRQKAVELEEEAMDDPCRARHHLTIAVAPEWDEEKHE